MKLERLVISAPFGNWLSFPHATSTLGTFTLHPRGGLVYRLWRCLRTLRYDRRMGGWVNRLGLPNPGIRSLAGRDGRSMGTEALGSILSIHGFTPEEWQGLVTHAEYRRATAVEFNLSCPNVGPAPFADVIPGLDKALRLFGPDRVITKLPPVGTVRLVGELYRIGVRAFHCCNTLPTPAGGLSGPVLKPLALEAVREVKQRWPDAMVIGGGGVRTVEDVRDYRKAGADHVAIASTLLNPFRWRHVPKLAQAAVG